MLFAVGIYLQMSNMLWVLEFFVMVVKLLSISNFHLNSLFMSPQWATTKGSNTQENGKNSSTPGVLSSWVLLRFIKCHVDNWSTSDVHQEAEKNVKRPLFPSSSPKLQKEKIKNNCRQFFFPGHKYTTHNMKNSA